MYNPSNHIPLSKSMGPNAFPIDGKYMFYTNGENGVYRYRPFQSKAEALTYFPLNSAFRGSPEGQPWAFEILINEGGTLSSDGGSITGGINSVWWWRDGVTDADLIKKNGPTEGDVKKFTFTESDLTNVADGMGDLILPFTGGQIAIALISRSGITGGIPSGNIVNSLAGGQVNSYNSISAAAQYGIVYYVGDPVQEPVFQAKIIIQNNSSQNVVYHGGDAVGTLLPGNGINENAIIGFTFSVDVVEGQNIVYTIYNSDGSEYFTNTVIGPGTQNGLPMTADKSQEFIITNT